MSKVSSETMRTKPRNKVSKRVRFSLPIIESETDAIKADWRRKCVANGNIKVHGTAYYINGTLNLSQPEAQRNTIDQQIKIANDQISTNRRVEQKTSDRTKTAHNEKTPRKCDKENAEPNRKNPDDRKRRSTIRSCTTILTPSTLCPKREKNANKLTEKNKRSNETIAFSTYEKLNYKLSEMKFGGDNSIAAFLSAKLRNQHKTIK